MVPLQCERLGRFAKRPPRHAREARDSLPVLVTDGLAPPNRAHRSGASAAAHVQGAPARGCNQREHAIRGHVGVPVADPSFTVTAILARVRMIP